MKPILFFFLLVISIQAQADYLLVTKISNLRKRPNETSEILEKLRTADTLALRSPGLTSGFYKVKSVASGQEGYIYKEQVQKVNADLPEQTDSAFNSWVDNPGVVDIRVVDVGQGLCTLIKLPGNKYMIYDAGADNSPSAKRTMPQIAEYIKPGTAIELMVLSHTDADHILAAGDIIRKYKVKKVLWVGFEKSMVKNEPPTAAFRRLAAALSDFPGTTNINLHARDSILAPDKSQVISGVTLNFLCGFGKPLAEWGTLSDSEKLNSVSIVMKLTYAGNSVLFCGDAVGRGLNDPESSLKATEKFLVDRASNYLASTVLIAPHHGARNASSVAFVDLVKPKAVIFSAGNEHEHPTKRTAGVYLRDGRVKIYRTDLGDDEGDTEWDEGRITGQPEPYTDKYNDDNIQIQLRSNRTWRVFYTDHE